MGKNCNRSISRGSEAPDRIGSFRGVVVFMLALSGLINILALTGSFYMLQIYDRALTSGSVPTLVALSALAIGLYLFQGVLRHRALADSGADRRAVGPPSLRRSRIEVVDRHAALRLFHRPRRSSGGATSTPFASFLSGQGPIALFDLPWMPIFLAFVYLLHPMLGLVTLAGALVLCCVCRSSPTS